LDYACETLQINQNPKVMAAILQVVTILSIDFFSNPQPLSFRFSLYQQNLNSVNNLNPV